MKKTEGTQADAAELRRRAEKQLKEKKAGQAGKGSTPLLAEESQRLIQELQIHQIELEMQNEALQQARAEVEEGLSIYTDLYDFAPVGFFTLDRDGTIQRVNLTGARLLGQERALLAGVRFGHFISEADRPVFNVFLQKVFACREKQTCEVVLRQQKNSSPSPILSGIPSCGETNRLVILIEAVAPENAQECRTVVADITDRKRAADYIKALLSEKELLLKEVHHRIKNNMAVIMSMLLLHADTLKDPSAAASLNDARSRVQSMMVLYDTLYRSADFRAISTKAYLPPLIDEIAGNFPNHESVTIETEIDDHVLDAKILSPLGIILNELLTNTMKHAFIGRKAGLLRVSFSVKDNHALLCIEDDGVGVPESVDIKTSPGFGMQLVGMLAEQIGGTIGIERQKGTHFILEFDV